MMSRRLNCSRSRSSFRLMRARETRVKKREKNESVNYGKRKCKSSACRSCFFFSRVYLFIYFFVRIRVVAHTHGVCDANFGT